MPKQDKKNDSNMDSLMGSGNLAKNYEMFITVHMLYFDNNLINTFDDFSFLVFFKIVASFIKYNWRKD